MSQEKVTPVLFNLRELMNLEEDRVRSEEEARLAREAAEREQLAEEARRRQEAEERRRQSSAKRRAREERRRVLDDIASSEERLEEIEIALADPTVHADGAKMKTLVTEQRALRTRVDGLYERWAELED